MGVPPGKTPLQVETSRTSQSRAQMPSVDYFQLVRSRYQSSDILQQIYNITPCSKIGTPTSSRYRVQSSIRDRHRGTAVQEYFVQKEAAALSKFKDVTWVTEVSLCCNRKSRNQHITNPSRSLLKDDVQTYSGKSQSLDEVRFEEINTPRRLSQN